MNRSFRSRFSTVLLLCVTASPALAADWVSVSEESELRFVARYEDQPLGGQFRRFAVTVGLDESGGAPKRLRVEVDVASADMGDREINDEIAQPDWFDVAQFPSAVFQSERIDLDENGRRLAPGMLELKGAKQKTTVPFSWQADGGEAVMTGAMTLSRGAWAIGLGDWENDDTIADAVELEFRVVLRPAD